MNKEYTITRTRQNKHIQHEKKVIKNTAIVEKV